jgi:hypothetical protein
MNTIPKESLNEPDIQTIIERLGKLERQNRRLRYAGVVTLIAFGALVIIGQTTYKRRVIRAEEFQLVDSHGNLKGRMCVDSDDPQLELFNQHGVSAVALYAYDKGNIGQLLLSSVESGKISKTSADSIVMAMPDGKVLWRAPVNSDVPINFSK